MRFSIGSLSLVFLSTYSLVAGCASSSSVSLGSSVLEDFGCQAVNDAIAALPDSGGEIRLPEGSFTCEEPIVIDRDHVTLSGAGSRKTMIRARDSLHPVPLLIIGSIHNTRYAGPYHLPYPDHQTYYVTVRGLGLDGGFRPPAQGDNKLECWDPSTHLSQACGADAGKMIRNNGLTIRGAEHIQVDDVASSGNYSGGLVTEKICRDLHLTNVDLYSNFFDGFAGYETSGSLIDGFLVHENGYSGISLDAEFNNNTFDHGRIFNNHDNGVFSADVGLNTYQHLEMADNGNYGFYIENFRTADGSSTVGNCDGTRILDSTVDMRGVAGSHSAIHFAYPCKAVEISNVQAFQRDFACLTSTSGVDAAINGSTCSDGSSVRPLALP
jgi:hypothetical protein